MISDLEFVKVFFSHVIIKVKRNTKCTENLIVSASLFPSLAFINLILMDPCIVDYSVEISTGCSFVIEFVIAKFIEGLTCFERHTAHHQELSTVFAASGLYTAIR
jgi:hypothetical protein